MPMLINHAENMNNCEVGRRFGVLDANIKRWRQQKEKMTNANSTQTHSSGLKNGHLQELEQEIIKYVHLKGETGVLFTCEMIKYKAQKLSQSHVMWHQFHATMGLHIYI
jgi:transposase-like protein